MGNSPKRRKSERARAYGRGSVYFDEARQAWCFQPPQVGGTRYPRQYFGADEAAAQLAQENWLSEARQGIDQAGGNQLMKDWLHQWHCEDVAPDAAPTYEEWNLQMVNTYLIPALGHYRVRDVTVDHVIAFRAMLVENLSTSSARSIYGVLDRAMDRAVKRRKITFNPCEAVDPPKRASSRATKAKRPALTIPQARTLLATDPAHRLALLFELALLYGLRKGEVSGLLWRDIDLEAGTFTISGQVQHTRAKKTHRADRVKTEGSERELALTPRLVAALRAVWARQQLERRKLGPEWKEHGLVFPSEVGTPLNPRNLSERWYVLCAWAGLVSTEAPAEKKPGQAGPKATRPRRTATIPFHALRHTAISRLVKVAPRDTVRAIVGHVAGDVTGDYIHVELAEIRAAIEAVERLYGLSEAREAQSS